MSAFFFLPEDRPLSGAPGPSPPSPPSPLSRAPGPSPPRPPSPLSRAPGHGLRLVLDLWRPRGPAVPHARAVCLTEEDGQPRVPRRAGLRCRHPVDVLQLLQIQPPRPRGGGDGQEAAGEPGAGGRASRARRGQLLWAGVRRIQHRKAQGWGVSGDLTYECVSLEWWMSGGLLLGDEVPPASFCLLGAAGSGGHQRAGGPAGVLAG